MCTYHSIVESIVLYGKMWPLFENILTKIFKCKQIIVPSITERITDEHIEYWQEMKIT